jgi:hypothetical protein
LRTTDGSLRPHRRTGFSPTGALKQVNADYPAIDTATNHDLRDLTYGPLDGVHTGDINRDGLVDVVSGWEQSGDLMLY